MIAHQHQNFRACVDTLIDDMIVKFYREVPFAQHLIKAEQIHLEYFKRFTIEIILRLRMKRTIDALTIHYFTKRDPKLAKLWAHYTEDEMLHDAMFVKDLELLGVPQEQIYTTEPFFSTKLLQGYFYYGLEHEGYPLASLTSSYFIEYTSSRTQPAWLDNVAEKLDNEVTKGARAHVNHDQKGDHIDFVWNVLSTFIKTKEDENRVINHLRNIYLLFMMFFIELYETVVNKNHDLLDTTDHLAVSFSKYVHM